MKNIEWLPGEPLDLGEFESLEYWGSPDAELINCQQFADAAYEELDRCYPWKADETFKVSGFEAYDEDPEELPDGAVCGLREVVSVTIPCQRYADWADAGSPFPWTPKSGT